MNQYPGQYPGFTTQPTQPQPQQSQAQQQYAPTQQPQPQPQPYATQPTQAMQSYGAPPVPSPYLQPGYPQGYGAPAPGYPAQPAFGAPAPAMMDLNSAGLDGQRSPSLPEGQYEFAIESIAAKISNQDRSTYLLIEMTCTAVFAQREGQQTNGVVCPPVRPGDARACIINTKHQGARERVKSFFVALWGFDEHRDAAEIAKMSIKRAQRPDDPRPDWDEVYAMAVAPENPFRGRRVRASVSPTVTKQKKMPIMAWHFTPYVATTQPAREIPF